MQWKASTMLEGLKSSLGYPTYIKKKRIKIDSIRNNLRLKRGFCDEKKERKSKKAIKI